MTSNDAELWLPIPDFEDYSVSSFDSVRSEDRQSIRSDGVVRFLKGKPFVVSPDSHGYMQVTLWKSRPIKIRIHRLVLRAFVGEQPTPEHVCRHLDGDRANNRLSNLCWGTEQQNQLDRNDHGTSNRGRQNGMVILTPDEVYEIRRLVDGGLMMNKDIATQFGVHAATVSSIGKRVRWQHLPEQHEDKTDAG